MLVPPVIPAFLDLFGLVGVDSGGFLDLLDLGFRRGRRGRSLFLFGFLL
jgi:hypothetical protein